MGDIYECINDTKSRTLLRGYVDHNKRIGEMMQAGINLENWRRGTYDFPEDLDEDAPIPSMDISRKKGYDMADASQDEAILRARIQAQQRLKKATQNLSSLSPGDNISSKVIAQEEKPKEKKPEAPEGPPAANKKEA